jgi:hypothetical protein
MANCFNQSIAYSEDKLSPDLHWVQKIQPSPMLRWPSSSAVSKNPISILEVDRSLILGQGRVRETQLAVLVASYPYFAITGCEVEHLVILLSTHELEAESRAA